MADGLSTDGFAVVPTDVVPAPGIVLHDVRDEAQWAAVAARLEGVGEPWGLVDCAARTVVRDLFDDAGRRRLGRLTRAALSG